jgi:hypothetical protein
MKRIGSFIFALTIGIASAGPALAVDNGQSRAVVVLHAQAHNTKAPDGNPLCEDLDPNLPCGEYTTTWPVGVPADVYLVVAKGDSALGVSVVSFGIQYGATYGVRQDGQGVDVFGYTSCSDLEYPTGELPEPVFPAAGAGNVLVWERDTDCQRNVVSTEGVQTVACVLYVYAHGQDKLIVDMNRTLYTGREFLVADCTGPYTVSDMPWPSHAGIVGFGEPGYNPCTALGVPVVRTSWGELKSQHH